jgi:hypothetical protein
LAAVLSANFDDSRASSDLWVIAGWAGYSNQWDLFEQSWTAALTRHGVPYFHMREMADPSGPFAKWLPPQEHVDEVVAFFKDLVDAIIKSALRMISSAVWLKDLERFNQEMRLDIEPYPLAAWACMSCTAIEYDQRPITAVFDRVEKVHSKLNIARSYADSDQHFPGLCDSVAAVPLQVPLTARNVPALQAADFIVWEVRKAHFAMKQWQHSARAYTDDRIAQWENYLEWVRQTTGANPVLRKSLDALISQSRVKSIVWDYQQLVTTNKARRGIWSCPDAGDQTP